MIAAPFPVLLTHSVLVDLNLWEGRSAFAEAFPEGLTLGSLDDETIDRLVRTGINIHLLSLRALTKLGRAEFRAIDISARAAETNANVIAREERRRRLHAANEAYHRETASIKARFQRDPAPNLKAYDQETAPAREREAKEVSASNAAHDAAVTAAALIRSRTVARALLRLLAGPDLLIETKGWSTSRHPRQGIEVLP